MDFAYVLLNMIVGRQLEILGSLALATAILWLVSPQDAATSDVSGADVVVVWLSSPTLTNRAEVQDQQGRFVGLVKEGQPFRRHEPISSPASPLFCHFPCFPWNLSILPSASNLAMSRSTVLAGVFQKP